MKRGLICRLDNSGLGHETWDFWRNMHFDKGLGIYLPRLKQYKDRYGSIPILADFKDASAWEDFFRGLDLVFTVESPYDQQFFHWAKYYKVKVVIKTNYEWLYKNELEYMDTVVYPEDWYCPSGATILTCPVYREKIPFKPRKKALRFVHFAGNSAGYDREGTELVKKANEMLTCTQIRIFDQKTSEFPTRDEMYSSGDVLIHPRRYGGQSLKLNEAVSSGMMVVMTDMSPQNHILPADWLIPAPGRSTVTIKNEVEYSTFDPRVLADKVESLYGTDISEQSEIANSIAKSRSWAALRPKWEEILS